MNRIALFPILVAAATAAPAHAAEPDFQTWGAATATIPAGDRLVVWLEAQGRFSDDAGRLGQLLLRPGVGVKLDPTTTAFLGYAYVRTDPVGPGRTQEHRIWQQLSFRIAGDGRGLTLTGRTRFEQRLFEGSSDMGFRLRQWLRLTAPLAGPVRAVGWTEGFVALNDTRWGQRSGFDRLRGFAGVAIPVSRALSLEPGYLGEHVRRPGRDRMNHVASLTLNAVF